MVSPRAGPPPLPRSPEALLLALIELGTTVRIMPDHKPAFDLAALRGGWPLPLCPFPFPLPAIASSPAEPVPLVSPPLLVDVS